MMRNKLLAVRPIVWILSLALLIIPVYPNADSVDIGGKLEMESGITYGSEKIRANAAGRGELEFYFPDFSDLDTRLVLRTELDDHPPEFEVGIKYAYLRYRFDRSHITLGRQPISWSYGAFMNPFDYRFTVEGLAGETVTPAVDGIRFTQFFGERSSLQLVSSFAEGLKQQPLDRLAYGVRLRVPVPGHDISMNASDQPIGSGKDNLFRGGITYSGDLGPFGIYGAFGYWRYRESKADDIVVQLGIDYSWRIGPEYDNRRAYLQAEYIRCLLSELSPADMFLLMDTQESAGSIGPVKSPDMFIAHLSMDTDRFTQIGAAVLAGTQDWFLAVSPYYQSELGSGLDLRIDGTVAYFSPSEEFSAGTQLSLTFYF